MFLLSYPELNILFFLSFVRLFLPIQHIYIAEYMVLVFSVFPLYLFLCSHARFTEVLRRGL